MKIKSGSDGACHMARAQKIIVVAVVAVVAVVLIGNYILFHPPRCLVLRHNIIRR